MTEYLVIPNPSYVRAEKVKAASAKAAARKADLGGVVWVIPVRNLTVYEATQPEPVQPPPVLVEKTIADVVAAASQTRITIANAPGNVGSGGTTPS